MRRSINCKKIADLKEFYTVIAKKMKFPEWFGFNLDALNDVLGDVPGGTVLVLKNFDVMAGKVGPKAETLRSVLQNAADENPGLTVKFL